MQFSIKNKILSYIIFSITFYWIKYLIEFFNLVRRNCKNYERKFFIFLWKLRGDTFVFRSMKLTLLFLVPSATALSSSSTFAVKYGLGKSSASKLFSLIILSTSAFLNTVRRTGGRLRRSREKYSMWYTVWRERWRGRRRGTQLGGFGEGGRACTRGRRRARWSPTASWCSVLAFGWWISRRRPWRWKVVECESAVSVRFVERVHFFSSFIIAWSIIQEHNSGHQWVGKSWMHTNSNAFNGFRDTVKSRVMFLDFLISSTKISTYFLN